MVDTIVKLENDVVLAVINVESGKHDRELCPCETCLRDTICLSCKTNKVGKNTFYCENCWNNLHSLKWGDIWYLICNYHNKNPNDKFVEDIIVLSYKYDREQEDGNE